MNALYFLGLLALLGAVMGLAIWLGLRAARRAGGAEARAKGREEVIENVEKAQRAVHRLDADPEYRRRLRKRHGRD